MNNCLRKKEIPTTAGDAFLNLALVMVPLGIALGVAWGAIELMPQLTLLNLITGIPLLAGYAGIRILQGIIPWLFLYFLLCRICDRLAAGGIPLSLLRWVMLLGAAGVGTVCTGYCNGLWMEYAGVSTRVAAGMATLLLMLPAMRGRGTICNALVLKSIYIGTLIFSVVVMVQAMLYRPTDYSGKDCVFTSQVPLLPTGKSSYCPGVSYAVDMDMFCKVTGKTLPEGVLPFRCGYYNTGAMLRAEMNDEQYHEFCRGFEWQTVAPGTCFRVRKWLELSTPQDFSGQVVPLKRSFFGAEQHFLLRDDTRKRVLLLILP